MTTRGVLAAFLTSPFSVYALHVSRLLGAFSTVLSYGHDFACCKLRKGRQEKPRQDQTHDASRSVPALRFFLSLAFERIGYLLLVVSARPPPFLDFSLTFLTYRLISTVADPRLVIAQSILLQDHGLHY